MKSALKGRNVVLPLFLTGLFGYAIVCWAEDNATISTYRVLHNTAATVLKYKNVTHLRDPSSKRPYDAAELWL